MDTDIDVELKEEFKRDFLDQLQEVERLLLKLEEEPDNLNYVRDIFRPFHTIKGNAGVIGETEIQDLSQLAETVLDLVRQGKRKLSARMIDAVFQTADLIKAITEQGRADIFSEQILENKELLTEVAVSGAAKAPDKSLRKKKSGRIVKIDPDSALEITRQLDLLRNGIIRCRTQKDFSAELFDIFDTVLTLSSLFEPLSLKRKVVIALGYLEGYLTVLNTSDISYSKHAWELLNHMASDIRKTMYPVLVDSLGVGVCYFNPSETIEDLHQSIHWIHERGCKYVMINLNRTTPPLLDEIYALIRLKKGAKAPVAFIQRFFGHKQYWRDIELLMDEVVKIETSFWNALAALVNTPT